MAQKNSCYTYFCIVGDFDPDRVTELLEIVPHKAWKPGELRGDGTQHTFSRWAGCLCEDHDFETANQMRKTIAPLLDKTDILNRIRLENDVSFYLEIVPMIYDASDRPVLNPPMDVIDFCHATRTEIDIDYYIY